MMTDCIHTQLTGFVIMLFGGAASGLLADLFFLVRSLFGFKRITASLTDLLLWALLAAGIFGLNLYANDGILRWYAFFGLFLGALLYYLLFSRIMRAVLGVVLKIFRKILCLFLKIVLTILAFLYKMLKGVFLFLKKLFSPVGKGVRHAGACVKCRWRMLRLVLKKK